MSPDCCICAQIAGDPELDLVHQAVGATVYERRALRIHDDFHAIPSVGALSEGHVLLCPGVHVRSFAELDHSLRDQVVGAQEELEKRVATVWSKPVHLFEHGNAAHGERVACSVEHAHLHFVPADIDVWSLASQLLHWRRLDAETLLAETRGREYVRYRSPNGRWWIAITDDEPIPSQLMRRVFAEALGEGGSWNWRETPRRDRVRKTWLQLATP